MQTRRRFLSAVTAGSGAMMLPEIALAQTAPSFVTMGYTLGIHVPSYAAMNEILPTLRKMPAPKVTGIEQIQTITQSVIAGASQFADADFLSATAACLAGADLTIVGNVYVNTSLVFVVNTAQIQTLADLFKPDILLAVNSRTDGTYVTWAGAVIAAGYDQSKLQTVNLGGSGTRTRALLNNRVAGTAIQLDQFAQLQKKGGYKILIEPWKTFHPWMNEVWVTKTSALKDPDFQRLTIDVLKAQVIAFRKATRDFDWYADCYRRYATVPNAAKVKNDDIRQLWETLSGPVAAWPADMNFSVANAQRLLPDLLKVGVFSSPVDFSKIMNTQYLEQALKELG